MKILGPIEGFIVGLGSSWTLSIIIYMFIGIILGFIVGALPGLNPSTAMAILIPVTFGMDTLGALVMLLAIYYGGLYGGAVTAIMINNPGHSAAVVTALEGYPLTQQGRSMVAMRVAMISSFVGGLFSVLLLLFLANPVMNFALRFGPPERFTLITMALLMMGTLGDNSLLKSIISAVLGLLIAVVGRDLVSGLPRLTFGIIHLYEGIPFVAVIMGMFAITEILVSLEKRVTTSSVTARLEGKWPTKEETRDFIPAIGRGTILGFLIGVIPAAGPQIATWFSYGIEKLLSKKNDLTGQGSLRGVAVSESSNNATSGGAMISLLTLGIPGSTGAAVLLGAFVLHGLRVGPLLFMDHPRIAWGIISSMFLGQFWCVFIGLALIPLFALILKISYSVLYPLIIVIATIGAFSLSYSFYPVIVLFICGILGYILRKAAIPPAPLILAIVLGPLWETAFKQSLTLSRGSYRIFIDRPISLTFLLVIVFFFLLSAFLSIRKRKKQEMEKGVSHVQ